MSDPMRNLAFAICALLAFPLPIGFYCLILASMNRRPKPLLVGGVWDAVGLLFAVSGFFLVTMPMMLSEFYLRTYDLETNGIFSLWLSQWLIWVVYFLFLISGAALMILWRSHKTMVYNVDPEQFSKGLERTLANLGLSAAMRDQCLIVIPMKPAENGASTAITETAPAPAAVAEDTRHAELAIDSFPAMCHVTLHWESGKPELRRQIEAELDKNLESAAPLENPAAGWFLNVSGMIFGTLIMVALAFAILVAMVMK